MATFDMIDIINETLEIIENGEYKTERGIRKLKLNKNEFEQVKYFSVSDVNEISKEIKSDTICDTLHKNATFLSQILIVYPLQKN